MCVCVIIIIASVLLIQLTKNVEKNISSSIGGMGSKIV